MVIFFKSLVEFINGDISQCYQFTTPFKISLVFASGFKFHCWTLSWFPAIHSIQSLINQHSGIFFLSCLLISALVKPRTIVQVRQFGISTTCSRLVSSFTVIHTNSWKKTKLNTKLTYEFIVWILNVPLPCLFFITKLIDLASSPLKKRHQYIIFNKMTQHYVLSL